MGISKKIAVLAGDGIGPEVIDQAVKILVGIADRFGHEFEFRHGLIGAVAIDKTGSPLPQETIDLCKNSDAILLGAIGDPRYADPTLKVRPEQGLLAIRSELGLFTNIRPVKSYDKLIHLSPLKREIISNVDFVIYRELTSGIYFGESGRKDNGNEAYDICTYRRHEIERIAHLAFADAQKRRKKLCLVDKANVLESSRLWREVVQEIAPQYADVAVDYLYVDNAAMQIILNPRRFDVMLTSNLFGDILSDEASVIAGSLGLLPSASKGNKYSLYEPVHGSYPEAAGKNIANPFATILSAAMMLEHFGLSKEAELVNTTIEYCMNKSILTEDLDPDVRYSCSQLGDVIQALIMEEDLMNIRSMKTGNSSII